MLWSVLIAVTGAALAAPCVRRYALRRRAVSRARAELAWFAQQRPRPDRRR